MLFACLPPRACDRACRSESHGPLRPLESVRAASMATCHFSLSAKLKMHSAAQQQPAGRNPSESSGLTYWTPSAQVPWQMPLRQPNSNSCAHDIDISLTNGRSQCRGEKRPAETNRHGTGWRGGVARQDKTKKRDRVGMHASMATPSFGSTGCNTPPPPPNHYHTRPKTMSQPRNHH